MSDITLKKNALTKFKSGHPWIFSNQLRFDRSSKTGLHDLCDEDGRWLAKGLLNPKSKIAFRVLTTQAQDKNTPPESLIKNLVERAIAQRHVALIQRHSCRLVHGEGDYLSGLIVDAFFTSGDTSELYMVVQSQSAGMDALQEYVTNTLKVWAQEFCAAQKLVTGFHILVKNDSSKRRREGLEIKPTESDSSTESALAIRVGSAQHPELLVNIRTNLWQGQKTGFFLDQSFNIDVVYELFLRTHKTCSPVRLLDICCYVGQWSTKLSKGFLSHDIKLESVAVDSSQAALDFTVQNVRENGGTIEVLKRDVFKAEWGVDDQSFDLVVCDPPALIKSRVDLKVGQHGYLKLNTLAIKKVKKDGLFVSCSCSGVLERKDFKEILEKAAIRAGRRILWIAEGRQSPDHPIRDWFPEGEYLKCFVGRLLD